MAEIAALMDEFEADLRSVAKKYGGNVDAWRPEVAPVIPFAPQADESPQTTAEEPPIQAPAAEDAPEPLSDDPATLQISPATDDEEAVKAAIGKIDFGSLADDPKKKPTRKRAPRKRKATP